MLTLEQIEALEAKGRNCRDNARAELVVRAAFEAEYHQGVLAPGRTKEMHARSMELYDFVIRGKHRANNFTDDAELFEAAAAMGRAQLAALSPTHRHVKSGRLERVIGEAEAQVSVGKVVSANTPSGLACGRDIRDGDRLTVYQGADGKLWVRFRDEFNDGRFVEIGAEEQS